MNFFCPKCGARYTRPDEEVPAEGADVACEKCKFIIHVKPRPAPAAAAPEPTKPKEAAPSATKTRDAAPAVSQPPRPAQPTPEPIAGSFSDEVTSPGPRPDPAPPPTGSLLWRMAARLPTGLSGTHFKFRDFFFALIVPFDIRKILTVGAGVFAGAILCAVLAYLGMKTGSSEVSLAFSIFGFLVNAICVYFALGIATHLTHREMQEGEKLRLGPSFSFVKSKLAMVLGVPLSVVCLILALVACTAVTTLIGRIPYAGPIVYGLSFVGTYTLACLAVLGVILLALVTFSYVPVLANENGGLLRQARLALRFFFARPGWYLVHFLLASLMTFVLMWLLNFLMVFALGEVSWVAAKLGGSEVGTTLASAPALLFGALAAFLPDPILRLVMAGADTPWQYQIGGWGVGIGMLAFFSLTIAFALVYFSAAGVVNVQLLKQKHKE